MIALDSKGAAEVWDIELDLTLWLVNGNTVASFTVPNVTGGVTITGATIDGNNGVFRLAGGTPGASASFTALGTMTNGQVFDQPFSVFIR